MVNFFLLIADIFCARCIQQQKFVFKLSKSEIDKTHAAVNLGIVSAPSFIHRDAPLFLVRRVRYMSRGEYFCKIEFQSNSITAITRIIGLLSACFFLLYAIAECISYTSAPVYLDAPHSVYVFI